jgi:hypothetical protein
MPFYFWQPALKLDAVKTFFLLGRDGICGTLCTRFEILALVNITIMVFRDVTLRNMLDRC